MTRNIAILAGAALVLVIGATVLPAIMFAPLLGFINSGGIRYQEVQVQVSLKLQEDGWFWGVYHLPEGGSLLQEIGLEDYAAGVNPQIRFLPGMMRVGDFCCLGFNPEIGGYAFMPKDLKPGETLVFFQDRGTIWKMPVPQEIATPQTTTVPVKAAIYSTDRERMWLGVGMGMWIDKMFYSSYQRIWPSPYPRISSLPLFLGWLLLPRVGWSLAILAAIAVCLLAAIEGISLVFARVSARKRERPD